MTETLTTEQVEEILAHISPRSDVASLATELLALRKRVEELEGAMNNVRSFIAVMHGRGPDAIIPETVMTPLGIPVKIGSIMRDVDAALPTPKEPS